jgi:chromosome partitioning protein
MEGLTELVKTIQLVHDHLNSRLKIEGIILTMFDARNNLARQVSSEVRNYFGKKVYDTVIPRNVKLSESPSHGKSILLYDVHSKGAKSYLDLTQELLVGKKEHNSVHDIVSNPVGGQRIAAHSASPM